MDDHVPLSRRPAHGRPATDPQTITFLIDPGTGLPPYRQITEQVKRAIRLGRLAPGDRLPTAVTVAATAGVSTNTVHRAYRDLQHQGVAESRARGGTYIQPQCAPGFDPTTRGPIEKLEAWIGLARAAGLDDTTIADLLDCTAYELAVHRSTSAMRTA